MTSQSVVSSQHTTFDYSSIITNFAWHSSMHQEALVTGLGNINLFLERCGVVEQTFVSTSLLHAVI